MVSEYLGHADPGFTLRTYTHLMPDSRARSVRAIDAVFDVDECDGCAMGRTGLSVLAGQST